MKSIFFFFTIYLLIVALLNGSSQTKSTDDTLLKWKAKINIFQNCQAVDFSTFVRYTIHTVEKGWFLSDCKFWFYLGYVYMIHDIYILTVREDKYMNKKANGYQRIVKIFIFSSLSQQQKATPNNG